jgi:hypothetical protein
MHETILQRRLNGEAEALSRTVVARNKVLAILSEEVGDLCFSLSLFGAQRPQSFNCSAFSCIMAAEIVAPENKVEYAVQLGQTFLQSKAKQSFHSLHCMFLTHYWIPLIAFT